MNKQPLLSSLFCKLGLHDWGIKYNKSDTSGVFYEKTVQSCRRCGKERHGKSRSDWDMSKGKY